MLDKIANKLTRRPKLVALIALLLLIPSALGFLGTRVNYDILSYLPEDLGSVQGERLLEEPFHDAATSMLIVEGMPAAYTNDLVNAIKKVEGVSNAVWLSNAVGVQIPISFIPPALRDMFFADNSTMMIIQYEKAGASEETMEAIREVRSLCNEKCFLAGFSVVIKDTKDLVDRELPVYVGLAVLLSLLAMSLTMESVVLPFVFLLSIGIAILYNFGTNILLGEISYITQAIAAVLQLGVTMDYSIFLYHRYREERPRHEDPRDAMTKAIAAAFTSLSGSSLTTIAGFLALCFMRLTLGRDIGIVMAKGVVLGVATVVLVLPAFLLIFDKQIEAHKHRTLLPSFGRLNHFIVRHRRWFVVLFLVSFLPAVYSQQHTQVYYKLDEALPQDMPSIVANNKLKNDYDMASTHFILLHDDLDPARLQDLECRLEQLDGVTSVLSYHKLLGSGIPEFFVPQQLRDMMKQGGWQLMMVNSKYATASTKAARQLDQLEQLVHAYDPGALLTGEAVLTDDLIDTSSVDFKVTNYISIGAILLIIAVIFRSFSIPLVLVAAIELAIFINQGIPYFTGTIIPFVSPTVIGCVQLGATVDYAILMATRFREELQHGSSRQEAIHIAATSSDVSILTSSLVLFCATMGVGTISEIEIISSICMMLARGALISALISMFIMPPVLCVFEPLFRKTSMGWSHPTPSKAPEAQEPAERA